MNKESKIYIALPALNEYENIVRLISNIGVQKYNLEFELFICINQPNSWWNNSDKVSICNDNQKSLSYLKSITKSLPYQINIIDKSSKGLGWKDNRLGVGWARKTLFDEINKIASNDDIIISLDADTTFSQNYIQSVYNNIKSNPDALALSVPYYHQLTNDNAANRAILHYEIYMRYYAINLMRIKSPYNFTALGSAIVFPIWAYRKVGGITPKKSGEDFYFLQKLAKAGKVLIWNCEKVYPAGRFSDRVFFGTGPAMIKGNSGDWSSYPIYNYRLFDNIKKTYSLFPALFKKDVYTPLDGFIDDKFKEDNIWESLRNNSKNEESFVRACFEKIDGLRILQYLKSEHIGGKTTDEKNLVEFLHKFYKNEDFNSKIDIKEFSFEDSDIRVLDAVRDFLVEKEQEDQLFSVSNEEMIK